MLEAAPAPAPAAQPVVPEPAPQVPDAVVEQTAPVVEQPAPAIALPDAAAYEMAAFELSTPPVVAASPEPVVEPAPEPIAEPVAEVQPPAWSYEQVARIEDAEHHVTAWVQPEPAEPEPVEPPQAEQPPVDPQPALHPVAAWEQASPEELAAPVAEPSAPVAQSTGWGVPAEPVAAPEPHRHPVAEWETPEVAATTEVDLPAPPAVEVPGQRSEEPAASIDLTEPAAQTAPEVDLSEQVEHDPVYAAVEAAARQERPQDDDGVVRWRW